MTRPFEGIRVIDVTHVLAGPFAAYQLAVLGADVIKVEHPDEPDQSRGSGTDKALNRRNMGTAFLTQASNKRSIALDLKQPGDREVLKKLVATADVFVENYRPGAFEALGLGYDALAADQPAADLCLVLGLRPARAARRPDRLRPRDPGDVRHHGDDRHQGRAPREDRRAGGRLRHRHDRRLRPVGRAVPARAHRARPAHRHGHARRGDDPDELASHRLSAQWRASQAPRQPPSACHQRRLRDQGRPGDAGRQQSAPAAPPVDGAGAAGHDQAHQRRARRGPRARDRGAVGDHAHAHRGRMGGVPAGAPRAGGARAHHGGGAGRPAAPSPRHRPSPRLRGRQSKAPSACPSPPSPSPMAAPASTPRRPRSASTTTTSCASSACNRPRSHRRITARRRCARDTPLDPAPMGLRLRLTRPRTFRISSPPIPGYAEPTPGRP